jgi:glycosyltransferase-like protein
VSAPLHVALLTYSTRPRGGVVHTLALAEALVALGHRVDVWILARGGDAGFFRAVDPGVRLRLVPFADEAGESVGARIVRSIAVLRTAFTDADAGYDVVHAQDCISANAVDDCIRTVHHLDTFTTPELAACHERALIRPSTHVCVSAAVATELATGWSITARVIPNGVDSAPFAAAAEPSAAAERAAWAHQLGPYVLAVGGIEPRKGTADLVEAMATVRTKRPELALVVAGGETLFDYRDYRDRVLARATTLGVHPVVLGPVEHNRLPALVAGAHVFAFPSMQEGFGLAAMEALAAGVPVVARDLPVLREVFGDTVVYANSSGLGDALLTAATHRDHHRTAAGRALAQRHTWHTAALAHVQLYRQRLDPLSAPKA